MTSSFMAANELKRHVIVRRCVQSYDMNAEMMDQGEHGGNDAHADQNANGETLGSGMVGQQSTFGQTRRGSVTGPPTA